MFILLSFIVALACVSNVHASHASATVAASKYFTGSFWFDHTCETAAPYYAFGQKLSTCEYDNVYTGVGQLVTFSTSTPYAGQIGVQKNTYANVNDVATLDCSFPADPADVSVSALIVPGDKCTPHSTVSAIPGTDFFQGQDFGSSVFSSGSTFPNYDGILVNFYQNDQNGLNACNDATANGATGTSSNDDAVVAFQWYATGVCNPVAITDQSAGGSYYKHTCKADGTITIDQYASQADCVNGAATTNTQDIPSGNGWCNYDWANANGGAGIPLNTLPGFVNTYHTYFQCVTAVSTPKASPKASPKAAPKVKLTKSPSFVKKGKKI